MDQVPLCDLPLDAGPCQGKFERFYYDKVEGVCLAFNYTGCKGNANHFYSMSECENACEHRARKIRVERVCHQPLHAGTTCSPPGPSSLARWYFDTTRKMCTPFYYAGCNGNENQFESQEDCEATCPNLYHPTIQLLAKNITVEKDQTATFSVEVDANPEARVSWMFKGLPINAEANTEKYKLENVSRSLVISAATFEDAGAYSVQAENGIGGVESTNLHLIVTPNTFPVEVILEDGADDISSTEGEKVKMACKVAGYPIPGVRWFKNNSPIHTDIHYNISSSEAQVGGTQASIVHHLVIYSSRRIDSGTYKCMASNIPQPNPNDIGSMAEDETTLSVNPPPEGVKVKVCVDKPEYANCQLVVRAQLCTKVPQYAEFCCKSCTDAGQLV